MADLRTYEGLKDAIADWTDRHDLLDSQIPVFIAHAENRMNRELRLRVMERISTLAVDAGQDHVRLPWKRTPGDWDVFLEMRDLVWQAPDGQRSSLSYMPPDDYAISRAAGLPRRYTIIGRELFLVPAPDTAGTLRLTYYAEIPPLSDEQPTNELLQTAPDMYLYGALVESVPYTRSSAPAELWTEFYAAARDKLQQNEQRARFTSNLRMQPCRRI